MRTLSKTLLFLGIMALVAFPGQSFATDVVENFDGLSESAYGTYDYNGWHMENTLCNSTNARSGNAPRLRNADPLPFLEYRAGDGNGKDGGVGNISFWYRAWDGTPAAVYDVKVNIDGAGWTNIGTQINTTSTTYAEWTHALDNPSDNIIVRVERVSGERLHVDDFTIADYGADTTPPELVSATAVSATQVDVLFNENVDPTTAEDEGNYSIDNGIGAPSLATRDGVNNALVHLTVSTLSEGITYTLTVNNVEDIAGNPITPGSQITFFYQDVEVGDLIITEIMPNPNAVYDDDGEWFEIYNTTASPINLNGLILHDNFGTHVITGDSIVAALDYFVFCVNETLATNGGVPTDYEYPYSTGSTGLSLSNSGDVVKICDPLDVIIDSVQYTDLWPFGTGASMQLRDVALNNDVVDNWDESENAWIGSAGDLGTPGEASDYTPDTEGPTLVSAGAPTSIQVDVLFNEDVDPTTAGDDLNYTIDGGITVSAAVRDASNYALVHLTVSTLTGYVTYTLTVNNVQDIIGNPIIPNSQITFEFLEEVGDVIITEFMVDPVVAYDDHGEWFEIYNNTGAQINLNGWILKDNVGADTIEGDNFVDAGDYFVFCVNETLAVNGSVPLDYTYVYGWTGWGLAFSNSNPDQIVIYDNLGQMQDSVAWDYTGWGITSGASHQLKDITYDNNIDTSWCISLYAWPGSAGDLGTPGVSSDCHIGDTTRPTISTVGAVNATQVDVTFNEDVDQTTAETAGNYTIDNGITVSAAVRDAGNLALVHLTVSSLSSGTTYTITINNVEDLSGNAILPNSQETFDYIQINPGDIIITEIMPNPGGTDSDREWFEIYNTTDSPINLNGWILHDAGTNPGTDVIVGDNIIAPHDYFVFCVEADSLTNGGVPEDYDYVYGYSGTGLALSNTEDNLQINAPGDILIDSVHYVFASWPCGDGSSMQLKDVALDNDVVTNWCASVNMWSGSMGDFGTPGAASDCIPPDTVAMTICETRSQTDCGVLDSLDVLARVKGVVSFADTCMDMAFIQDGGCGITLYGLSVETVFPAPANRIMRSGDSVQVTGYLTQYAGLAEIAYAFGMTPMVALLDSDKVVTVTSLACSLISDAADVDDDSCSGEDYESEKVQVDNITFVNAGTFSPGDANYAATCAAGDTIMVRVDSCSSFLDQAIPVGSVNMVGILGQFDWSLCYCQGYQVYPMEFTTGECDSAEAVTVIRSSTTPENVIVRWQPSSTLPCDCYKIYSSTDPFAVFPGAGWTEEACVCGVTEYEYAPPVSTTSKLFYRVTAVDSCP